MNITPQERLKEFANKEYKSMASFARFLGITPQHLNNYLTNGKSVIKDYDKLEKLKEAGLNIDWYVTGNGEMLLSNKINQSELEPVPLPPEVTIKLYDISVYANVGGGITDINQVPYSFMPIASNYKDCVAFKVTGESMIEEGIIENDILIVNPNIKPKNNNLVVLNLNGLLMVKRIIILENGNWELHSSNAGVEPIKKYDQDTMIYLGSVIESKRIFRN